MSITERWNDDANGFIYGFVQCLACKNLIDSDVPSCKAFDLIPDKIWNNDLWHDKPLAEQDNDVVFEQL